MDDLISRTAAIAQIKENYCDWCDHTDLCKSCETYDCIATIEQLPAVDVVPVVHAYWIDRNEDSDGTVYRKCSACKDMQIHYKKYYPNFCPECGAKMDGDTNG